MEKYLAMKQEMQESDNQSTNSNQSAFAAQSVSSTQSTSTADVVAKWYNEEFRSGNLSETSDYSKWLPENYEKYKEMEGTEEFNSIFQMVFDALAKDKVITDQDIAEGIQAITKIMDESKLPTTLEEMNFVVMSSEKISQLQTSYQEEIRKAEEKLEQWEEENSKQ